MNPLLSHNIIKRFAILFLFSATSFLLTGCWDRREVNDTAMVLGAAIDQAKNEKIKLTVQILIPRSAGGGQQGQGAGGTNSQVLVRSAVGENMADASSKLQTKFPRKIFWGHCKAYVLGEKLAKAGGIHEQIDFLLRHPEPRESARLFVSHGEAAKIMELNPPLELYIGEVLRKLSEEKIGVSVTVKDFEQMLTSDAEAPVLPLIRKIDTISGDKEIATIAAIIGTAIFKKDKMIGQIDVSVTRGMLWLRNEIDVTAVTINPKKGETVSLDPVRERTKFLPSIENGRWKVLVKIVSEGTIVQNGSQFDMMSSSITKKLEQHLEKDIKKRINLCLTQVKGEMNADPFGFADAFHRKYPKEWEKVKDHWDEVLPQVDVKIALQTRIRRPGLSTTPAGLKEDEVEK